MTEKNFLQARIVYKTSKRGTREMEVILRAFNEKIAINFNEQENEEYESILDKTDQDIIDILRSPTANDGKITLLLRDFLQKNPVINPVIK